MIVYHLRNGRGVTIHYTFSTEAFSFKYFVTRLLNSRRENKDADATAPQSNREKVRVELTITQKYSDLFDAFKILSHLYNSHPNFLKL